MDTHCLGHVDFECRSTDFRQSLSRLTIFRRRLPNRPTVFILCDVIQLSPFLRQLNSPPFFVNTTLPLASSTQLFPSLHQLDSLGIFPSTVLFLAMSESQFLCVLLVSSILTRPGPLLAFSVWDQHVQSEAFNRDCVAAAAHSKRLSPRSSGSQSYEHVNLWESDDASSSIWVDSSVHGVPKLEAYLYFYGLRGERRLGPKLIYRTSKDIFSPPSGPSQDVRKMQLLTVHEHAKLGQNNLWATIRDKVRDSPSVVISLPTFVPRRLNYSTTSRSSTPPSTSFVFVGRSLRPRTAPARSLSVLSPSGLALFLTAPMATPLSIPLRVSSSS